MSTRCQVIIKDQYNKNGLWFYRHSDGYPDGALPTLTQFMTWVKEGEIRNNVEQASGWLIMIGAQEYGIFTPRAENGHGWKVGAYEPSVPHEHGDIEYLYTLDLSALTIHVQPKYDGETAYYAEGWQPEGRA